MPRPGDVQGQPVELDDEETRFLLRAYEIDDAGRRVVRRACFSRPKGRAKTELSALVACAEALGPVRFAHWDESGKPVGRPVRSPFVRLAATEEQQAAGTYDAVRMMLSEGPIAETVPGLDVGLTRTFLPGGGKIVPVTAAAASKEGGRRRSRCSMSPGSTHRRNCTACTRRIRRNLAKRKAAEPWSLETTAMYAVGRGISSRNTVTGTRRRSRRGASLTRGSLFDHRQAPDGFDYSDDDELRAALAYVYGEAASWMDLDRLVAEARDSREDEFRRFFLNQPVARSTHWLSPAAWEACKDAGYQAPEGTRVVLAFDGSYRLDSSALVACTVEERPYLWVVGLWERPDRAPADWTVDRAHVDSVVREAMQTFDVAELAYDPPGWHSEADAWADSFGDVVVAFPTSTRSRMAAAVSRFYSAVMGGQVAHDGDSRLARHIANAVTKETSEGAYIIKDGPNSPRRIDAAVSAVVAHERARWHVDHAVQMFEPFQAWA